MGGNGKLIQLRITNYELRILRLSAFLCGLILLFVFAGFGQTKIAVLTPQRNFQNRTFAEKLEAALTSNFKVLDESLSETAFQSANYEKPYNLSLEEAKNAGAAIGCDYFLLLKAETLRRYSFEKKEFYESYAAVFAVSSRSGRLVFWQLVKGEAENAEKSERILFEQVKDLAAEISEKLKAVGEKELSEKTLPKLAEMPAANSPDAKNFRPPLPYKRISPKYTALANLYGVAATVDIEIDVDENGEITRSEIVRWAGFGLDESVTENVRAMNWKPADRDGKPFPMRVLLRYNFKKIERDEQ